MHPAAQDIDDLLKDCDFRRQRRSGPGGQHRNKVETGVFVKHNPTTIEAAGTEERSQSKNRKVAIERLRVKLAIEHRDSAVAAEPSALWRSRCRGGRISVSGKHVDFATLLAEALDALHHRDCDFERLAEYLDCTRSQIVKLLSIEPAALTEVNRWRAERNQKPLSRR